MSTVPRVLTVLQARAGSTRLPGKVLLPLAGGLVLDTLVERVREARLAGVVVVATTRDPADDVIVSRCRTLCVPCIRGNPTDLLDRHRQAARSFGAEHVVKIPSDCPLVDPAVIDRVVGAYLSAQDHLDYASNLHPETYPDGNDVEVFSVEALEAAWLEARQPWEREHTTPFFWDQPDRFRLTNVSWETGRDLSRTFRYVLDYPKDYQVIRHLVEALGTSPRVGVSQIVAWLEAHPEVARLNASHIGTNWYRQYQGELRTGGHSAALRPTSALLRAAGPPVEQNS